MRWIEDRWEHLVSATQSRQNVQRLTTYTTREGELLALDARFLADGGAYAMRTSTAAVEANMATSIMPGPYRIRNYRFEAITVATNKAPIGPFRGVGRPAAVFAMERMMDETAAAIGMEPHEFRLRNMINADEHPYVTATGLCYDSGDYKSLLRKTVAAIDVAGVRAAQAKQAGDARVAIGVGFGCYTEQTAHGAEEWNRRGSPFEYGFESARIRIDPSGGILVSTGIQSHGQGLETTLAQVAADAFGVTYDRVTVRHGDTELCPYGLGTVASRSMVMAGGAVHGAGQRLAEKIRRIAAAVLEVKFEDVVLAGGSASADGRELTLEEIARIAYLELARLPKDIEPGLEILFNYRPSVETGAWSSGVDAARVEVDLDTGSVRLLDLVLGEDCGFVVNPLVADGQVIGGAAQGIGQALYEELRYDEEGQPITVNLADYLMPGAAEMPPIRIIHQETLSPFTVFGMKGLGEGGCIAPPAAIANAVSDALRRFGVDVRSGADQACRSVASPGGRAKGAGTAMKFPGFAYSSPTALPAALAALAADDDALAMAGGQSLLPMLGFRVVRPSRLIDIARVPELRAVEATADTVRIGAGVTHGQMEDGAVPVAWCIPCPRGVRHRVSRHSQSRHGRRQPWPCRSCCRLACRPCSARRVSHDSQRRGIAQPVDRRTDRGPDADHAASGRTDRLRQHAGFRLVRFRPA